MSSNPSKLSQFWQELKRRKVIYVITVYASAAFVIIELANNVVEPLNLPGRTPTFVIIFLAIGFPIAIILSWIFDMTPKGMEKSKPLSDSQEGEKQVTPNGWKIATIISFAVIMGLIILNIATGGKQLRAGDIQSLVILPFDNFTGDENLEYFVSGMHSSLIGDIGKISGLRVISKTSSNIYKDIDMSVPEIATELMVDAVVEATVMCLGDSICIQFKLISAFPEEEQRDGQQLVLFPACPKSLQNTIHPFHVDHFVNGSIAPVFVPQQKIVLNIHALAHPEDGEKRKGILRAALIE